jgi:serine/threonine protein phosphatase PrpC
LHFEYATRASKGARSYQEDAVALLGVTDAGSPAPEGDARVPVLTAVLADGMGGHAGGARASALACANFLDIFVSSDADASRGDTLTCLTAGLDGANAAIQAEVEEHPALAGMGCTLVGAAFTARGIEWVSVGDSPVFLVRGDEIVVLNEDHSLAPEIDKLAAAGKISWEAALSDPRRHFLRSALTGGEIELVDCSMRPLALAAQDIVIMASDGIHTLAHDDIRDITRTHAESGSGAIADALLAQVAERRQPYQDNTTLIVVRVH